MACRLEQSQTLIPGRSRAASARMVAPQAAGWMYEAGKGLLQLYCVGWSTFASSVWLCGHAVLVGTTGMAVWPESGKIGIDLSSMIVTEASRVDLTVYGGAGAGHWPRFRPRQIGRNLDVREAGRVPRPCASVYA